ncbi:MAG: PqqD family protein [Actinobacteria bacterium]|nr:PqqD family protein [Actinomycetota bacterium]
MGLDDGTECPRARREGLTVETIDNEVLVFDEASQRMHCLNRSAALVWAYCDGRTPVAEMARRLGSELGVEADADVVHFALRQLAEQDLLEEAPALPSGGALTRRQLLARLGAAAVIVPVVTSIAAPRPAAALSPGGTTMTTSSVTGTITGVG